MRRVLPTRASGRLRVRLAVLLLAAFACRAYAVEVEAFAEPYRLATVATAQSGIITTLSVVEGQSVSAGDEIANLDEGVLRERLAAAEARARSVGGIRSAQAVVALRRTRLEALRKLERQGHGRGTELESAKAELEIARANLLGAREQKQVAELEARQIAAQLDRRIIKSPFDGVVTVLHREVGELVGSGSAAIIDLADLGRLLIVAHVGTGEAAKIRPGQEATVRFGGETIDVPGIVERIAPVIDADSGTVRVRVVVDNAKGLLRAGERCFVRF